MLNNLPKTVFSLSKHGEFFDDEDDIARVFTSHFQNLFSSSDPTHITEAVSVVNGRVARDMLAMLDAKFTSEEIYIAIKKYEAFYCTRT